MPPSSCWQRGFGGWNLWLKPQVLLPPGGSKRQAMKRPGRDAGQPAWLCRGAGCCLRGHLHGADHAFCTPCTLGSRVGPAPPLAPAQLI